jgi:hypothetical protein
MTSDQIIQYATIGTAIAAVFGVAFAMFSHRRQINASIYLELSDRLHRLLRSVPGDYRSAHLAGKEPEGVDSAQAIVIAADFLHVVNSAHTLYRCGYFSGKLWKQLKGQAERGLRNPVLRDHWPKLREQFSQDSDFVGFVEECHAQAGTA